MANFQVLLNNVDITEHVERIRDVNASADYPYVNQYRIREATLELIDPQGQFALRNPNSLAKVGYPIIIDVDANRVFTGEVIERSQGVVDGSIILICSGGSWKIGRDEVKDFGVRRRFRLNQESRQKAAIAIGKGQHRANGVYPILPAALPASNGSTSGYGKSLTDRLIPVENLKTDGLLDYHRFIVDFEGVKTEGGPIPNPGAAFPQVILKSPYRHQRALTMVREILTAFGIANSQLQIAPADIGEHFAQRGRVNYDLIGATGDRYDVPLAWTGFITGFRVVGDDHYYLVSIPRGDNLYESAIVKYDGTMDRVTIAYRFPRGTEIWDLAINNALFYILAVSSDQPYYTDESGSDVKIIEFNTANDSTSEILDQDSALPPIICNHIRGGFGRHGHHADNRSGFDVHNGNLYYRYKRGTTAGIARYRFPSAVSVMSFLFDGNENDSNFAFSISGNMLTGGVSWRDGTDSECEVFAVDLS